MRRVAVLALAFVLWASPAVGEDLHSVDQAPCMFLSKHDVKDSKARRRCHLPDGTVSRFYERGRWHIVVTG